MHARAAIANDNIPCFVESPSWAPAEGEDPPVTSNVTPAERSEARTNPLVGVTLVWCLAGAVLLLLLPHGLPWTAGALVTLAGAATLGAAVVQSRVLLTLAAATLAVCAVVALQATIAPIVILGVGTWACGLWLLQASMAAIARSSLVAAFLSICAASVGAATLGSIAVAVSSLPLLAAGGMLGLGIARMASKADVTTASVHYATWWCGVVTAALAVQLLYPALGTPTLAVSMGAALLATAAAGVWSLGRGFGVVSAFAVLAAFALSYNAPFTAWLEASSGVQPTLLTWSVFGSGVMAAGVAMCGRGLWRNEPLTMILGAVAVLVEAVLVARLAPGEPVVAALTLLLAGLATLWLLSLRA